jgi:hypothetical protein
MFHFDSLGRLPTTPTSSYHLGLGDGQVRKLPYCPSLMLDVFEEEVGCGDISLLSFKNEREAYELTSLSVRLCAPTNNF